METVELTTTGVAAGGDAIARDEGGRVVFVEGALPGEVVRVELTEQRRDFARARVVEVVSPSPDRVDAPCAAFARGCGGCPWQWVAPEAQRGLKRDIVVDALRRIAHIPEPPVADEVRGVADRGYRTTVRVAVKDGRAAYRMRHSHELVTVEDGCLVAHPALDEVLRTGRFQAGDDVVVRVGTEEEVAGRRWRVSRASFFQSGPEGAELLVAAVRAAAGDALSRGGVLVDAYAGVGLLGGALAAGRDDVHVVALESGGSATRDARHNLAGLDAEVVRCDVARWEGGPAVAPAAVVVADPARAGLGRRAVAALAAAAAPTFVLVACDAASLGRDLVLLEEAGYRLRGVQVLDLFPHTVHVEAVARLEKR